MRLPSGLALAPLVLALLAACGGDASTAGPPARDGRTADTARPMRDTALDADETADGPDTADAGPVDGGDPQTDASDDAADAPDAVTDTEPAEDAPIDAHADAIGDADDDTADVPSDDTGDAPVDDATDAPDGTGDLPVDDTPDAPVDDTPDAPVDDTPDVPVDTPDVPFDDGGDASEGDAADGADTCPDADHDGVCDADDICPLGDDGIDLDRDGVPDACEPTRGSYVYDALEVGGLRNLEAVAFHPDGSYFVALARTDRVYVYEVDGEATTIIDLDPPGDGHLYFTDIAFEGSGDSALVLGYDTSEGSVGVVLRFDDATWRSEAPSEDALTRLPIASPRPVYSAIAFSPGHDEHPLLLGRGAAYPYRMWIDSLDPITGETTLLAPHWTTIGCDDIAYVENEFGNPGYLVVCGLGGYDGFYWTEVGGLWELREELGFNLLGNTSRIVAHPSGAYALAISHSGDRIHRFEGGVMNRSTDAPWFTTRRLWAGAFDAFGMRALIVGERQTISRATFGGVFEFRHDEYVCPVPLREDCEIVEVSIPNFDSAPFRAPSNTRLSAVAWRPGCDGGVIVGGKDDFSGSFGFVATFQLEGGRACW